MPAAIIPIIFFSCTKNVNIKNIESVSISTGEGISTPNSQILYGILVSDYSNPLSASSNSWKTFFSPD
jgi:hypothetical protein